MRKVLGRFLKDETGATAIEYGRDFRCHHCYGRIARDQPELDVQHCLDRAQINAFGLAARRARRVTRCKAAPAGRTAALSAAAAGAPGMAARPDTRCRAAIAGPIAAATEPPLSRRLLV
jgi:hypothetical protein